MTAELVPTAAYGAVISPCGRYRYDLARVVGYGAHSILWVMLNPSTADDRSDDATIRRCRGFSRAWGYRRMRVVNLYAFRATSPCRLCKADDPVGPQNNAAIVAAACRTDIIVCAWGGNAPVDRAREVEHILSRRQLFCLGKNADGSPKHPLYVRADQRPVEYRPGETSP